MDLTFDTKSYIPEIAESEITDTLSSDIVIAGEGFAALCTALSALESGASVMIVTASKGPVGRGGSVFASYSKLMEEMGVPRMNADSFILSELEANEFLPDARKWYRLFDRSEEAMNWLIDKMRAAGITPVLEDTNRDEPESPTYQIPGTHGFTDKPEAHAGVGISLVINELEREFISRGGKLLRQAVAVKLEKCGGRVCSLIARTENGYIRANASRALVLATGDFSANRELMQKFCPGFAGFVTQSGDDYDASFVRGGLFKGDGHILALDAGAAWQKTWPCAVMIQGSRLCSNTPYGSHRGLRLNSRGERFCNEDMNGAYTALNAIREKRGPFIIWGKNYAYDIPFRTHGSRRDSPDAEPEKIIAGWETQVQTGRIVKADTLEGVIEKLGLPLEKTLSEIERYNSFCRSGKDEDFHKKPKYLQEIREAPFYGGELNDSAFYTVLGGPRTDWHMRVCNENDEPIPGLFCVGSMVGDMYAGCYNFRIPGHNYGASLTFGYLTGRFIMGIDN